MSSQSIPCHLVSWEEAYQLSRRLARSIKSSGYRPQLVIAIGRGGYVPARIVCDFLLHNMLTSFKIEHWDTAASMRPEAAVRFPLAVDVRGQSVLIIDDVTDTGDTLRTAIDYVKDLGAGEIRTGVMQHKTASPVVPDFYAEEVKEWVWIIYPWAVHEDLVGFAEKVLDDGPASLEQVSARLKERYDLSASEEDLAEAMDDLVGMKKAEMVGKAFRKV